MSEIIKILELCKGILVYENKRNCLESNWIEVTPTIEKAIIALNEHDSLVAEVERLKQQLNEIYNILYCDKFEKRCNQINSCEEKIIIGCYKCNKSCFMSTIALESEE